MLHVHIIILNSYYHESKQFCIMYTEEGVSVVEKKTSHISRLTQTGFSTSLTSRGTFPFHLTQYLNFTATAGYNHFITDSLRILIRKLIHCIFTEDGKVRRACLRTAGVAAGGTEWKQWVWLQRLFTETLL